MHKGILSIYGIETIRERGIFGIKSQPETVILSQLSLLVQ
jgi:hypothetical protein